MKPTTGIPPAVKLTPDEVDRADRLAPVIAADANRRSDVRNFRARFLGGRFLSEAEARDFLAPRLSKGKKPRRRRVLPLSLWSVEDGSPLDHLRRLARELALRCQWRELDAAWFVLRGWVPPYHPIIARPRIEVLGTNEYGTIELRVATWVDAETVSRVFREQRWWLHGRDAHPVSARTVCLYDFCRDGHALGESWETIRWAWNRAHRDKAYGDVRRFRRAFERAEAAMATVRPDLRLR